jgi:hypothetical protein
MLISFVVFVNPHADLGHPTRPIHTKHAKSRKSPKLASANMSTFKHYRILAMRLCLKSRKISRAALWPGHR